MNPNLLRVDANENFSLLLQYDNGECRMFDVKPSFEISLFKPIQRLEVFQTAIVEKGRVFWPIGIDILPETLYEQSILVKRVRRRIPYRPKWRRGKKGE